MSLLPYLLDSYSRPSRILDQHFGLSLDPDDLMCSITDFDSFPKIMRTPVSYIRPWRNELTKKDDCSTLSVEKNKFQANLDVQQFKPEEITVKVIGDNTVTVEGKHEEKQDDHGFISRHFVRRYVLPKDCDYSRVESKLSSDGVLTITAPLLQTDGDKEGKTIPIIKTGQPAKFVRKSEEMIEEPKKKKRKC